MTTLVLHRSAGTPFYAFTVFVRRVRKKLFGVRKRIFRATFKADTFFDKSIKGGGFM